MPIIDGVKYACEPCMRGHRSSKCNHVDRILIKVRKPGRPLSSCPHEAGSCSCEVASVAIPKLSSNCPCGSPGGSKTPTLKKEDKGIKLERNRAGQLASPLQPSYGSNGRQNIAYDFQNGFITTNGLPVDNGELISPLDQRRFWQNTGGNVMNGQMQFDRPADMQLQRRTSLYGDERSAASSSPMLKKTGKCCKSESNKTGTPPANGDVNRTYIDATANMYSGMQTPPTPINGSYIDSQKDPRRRHTVATDMYGRRHQPSYNGYPMSPHENGMHMMPGYDGRSMSLPMHPNGVPNGLSYINGQLGGVPEDSLDQNYAIYSVPPVGMSSHQHSYNASIESEKFNIQQMMYMQAIQEAQRKQQEEEANAAQRAAEAAEHNENNSTVNGNGNGIGRSNGCGDEHGHGHGHGSESMGNGYAVPHGDECACGPQCNCVMCSSHPYNQATIDYIRNMHQQMATPEHTSEERSSATSQGLIANSTTASGEYMGHPPMNYYGDNMMDANADDGKLSHTMSNESVDVPSSGFVQVDYNMGSCAMQQGGCMCGDGCTCVGCLTHGGHNGVELNLNSAEAPPENGSLEHMHSKPQNYNAANMEMINVDTVPYEYPEQKWKREEQQPNNPIPASATV